MDPTSSIRCRGRHDSSAVMPANTLSAAQDRLFDMDETDRRDVADPRLQVASAGLYLIGFALGVVGTVGALLWAPLLWCAAAGFVVIAVAFAISGGRF